MSDAATARGAETRQRVVGLPRSLGWLPHLSVEGEAAPAAAAAAEQGERRARRGAGGRVIPRDGRRP